MADKIEMEVPPEVETGVESGQRNGYLGDSADSMSSQKTSECKDEEKTKIDKNEEVQHNGERTETSECEKTYNVKEQWSEEVLVQSTGNHVNLVGLEADIQDISESGETNNVKEQPFEEEPVQLTGNHLNSVGLEADIQESGETNNVKEQPFEEGPIQLTGNHIHPVGLESDIQEASGCHDSQTESYKYSDSSSKGNGNPTGDGYEEDNERHGRDWIDDSNSDCEQEEVTAKNIPDKKKYRAKPGIQRPYGGSGAVPKKEKKQKNKREEKSEEAENTEECRRNKKEKFHFFWRSKSVFSQWYKSSFYVEDIEYNCAEQYMMHQKALLMGDNESAEVIMALDEPREQKEAGRTVQNWNQEKWDENCMSIVKQGNIAKFSQDRYLKEMLFQTYPKLLVEASPYDKVWGIGLSEQDPRAWNRKTWKGENRLGQILTDVREELMKDAEILPAADK